MFGIRKEEAKVMPTKEFEELVKRIITCEARLNSFEIENKTLRDKVLRKIQTPREEEEELKPPKSINSFSPFGL
jgi:hypothetical protein